MRADTPPDLMTLWSGSWLIEGVREDLLTDLTEINAQIELDTLYEEQLQNQIERGGRHYFVPVGYHWRGIYYNVEIFNQLGLETPQIWDEWLEVADTLRNNGIIPFAIPRQDEGTASIWFDNRNMRLNGAEFHRALIRGEVSYTDERVHNVFLTWQRLFDLGYFTTDVSVSDGFLSAAAIIRGDGDTSLTYEKAAMSLLASFDFEDLPQVFQDELSVFPFPQINSTIPQGETLTAIGYGVPSGALNRIQAMVFVNYMTTADAQANIIQGMSGEAHFIPIDTTDREQLPRSVQQGLEIAE